MNGKNMTIGVLMRRAGMAVATIMPDDLAEIKRDYTITETTNADGSTTYRLIDQPDPAQADLAFTKPTK